MEIWPQWLEQSGKVREFYFGGSVGRLVVSHHSSLAFMYCCISDNHATGTVDCIPYTNVPTTRCVSIQYFCNVLLSFAVIFFLLIIIVVQYSEDLNH